MSNSINIKVNQYVRASLVISYESTRILSNQQNGIQTDLQGYNQFISDCKDIFINEFGLTILSQRSSNNTNSVSYYLELVDLQDKRAYCI